MNIYETLRKDHDKQRTLVNILARTSGDSEGRRDIFKKLKEELENHALAEEKHFYRHLMREDNAIDKARHSIAEHKELDDLVEELDRVDFSASSWLGIARKLKQKLNHHLDEEEHEIFQMSGKVLTVKEKNDLAEAFQEERPERQYH